MSIMNGYETTKIIKINKEIKTLIVCISTQESVSHLGLCKESSMNHILIKLCFLYLKTRPVSKLRLSTAAKLKQILKRIFLIVFTNHNKLIKVLP